MRIATSILAIGLTCCSLLAYGANSQQNKMKDCNAQATQKQLNGDDRKAFMKTCLSASSAGASTLTPQQQKMKTCNADATAKALKGTDRKTFMSTCLKAG